MIRILDGDCRAVLATLPAGSVHCCVTSPPYFGLRDYGHGGQIGLEATPEAFVAELVAVFREVRRVLRDDGTLWLNLGDSYNSGTQMNAQACAGSSGYEEGDRAAGQWAGHRPKLAGLKTKDLIGIPWRVAFALQADGWVLRQEIIWGKPNPMPESVTDRCTKSHEQLFLFAKASWVGPPPGRFAHISDQDARWLALLIDAEGCIVVKRNQHEGRADTFAPQVSIGNTSEALMREVVRIVGHGNLLEREGKNCRMLYWQLANGLARDLLHRLYPWFIVKQRQARIGIFVDSLTYARGGKTPERKNRSQSTTDQLLSLWARNKECNSFGQPDLSDVPEPEIGRWGAGPTYFCDMAAIAEPEMAASTARYAYAKDGRINGAGAYADAANGVDVGGFIAPNAARTKNPHIPTNGTRNKRSVWTVATQPFKEAHFATFPPALIEPCILAGAPAQCCETCGAPWERITETSRTFQSGSGRSGNPIEGKNGPDLQGGGETGDIRRGPVVSTVTLGFAPSCSCAVNLGSARGVVLDPFGGAGTTGLVADRLQRDAILIELNPAYAAMARSRLIDDAPLFAEVA